LTEQTETKPPLYLFAGGGTGGHLAPGIGVAEQLRREQPDCRIRFVGAGRPVEQQMLEPTGFEYSVFETLPLNALKRRPHRFVMSHWTAFRKACRDIDQDQPAAVIGLGGFASVPFALAARKRGLPCLLLEQNTVPGKANRWLSKWHPICLTFEESAQCLPSQAVSHLTGNPLRAEIRELAISNRPLPLKHPTLLILGGSLGSRQINESVINAIGQLATELTGWRVMHQTGPQGADEARKCYSNIGIAHEVAPFFSDMPVRLASATLAIARAGATTIAELSAVGIPAVLIPYPAAADDHQSKNARLFAEANAAVVVTPTDRSFEPVDLAPDLAAMLNDRQRLLRMSESMKTLGKPDASANVATILQSLIE
jgi:UDP-N-acetylglucosamine--N-acetylmuramyl-(pentapeptide) pyrophosphoryl-undecaprenol N-acetylglucosamine transferase